MSFITKAAIAKYHPSFSYNSYSRFTSVHVQYILLSPGKLIIVRETGKTDLQIAHNANVAMPFARRKYVCCKTTERRKYGSKGHLTLRMTTCLQIKPYTRYLRLARQSSFVFRSNCNYFNTLSISYERQDWQNPHARSPTNQL